MTMRKYMRGVTLTELMIVVVIVSILAMVSYPSYREYAARAKRNEAKACLLQVATQQERFYLQNNTQKDAGRIREVLGRALTPDHLSEGSQEPSLGQNRAFLEVDSCHSSSRDL